MLDKASPFLVDSLPDTEDVLVPSTRTTRRSSIIEEASHEFLSNDVKQYLQEAAAAHNNDDLSTVAEMVGAKKLTDEQDIQKHSRVLDKNDRKTRCVSLLLILIGAIVSVSFLYVGITKDRQLEAESFEDLANHTAQEVSDVMAEFESSALWIHESCRNWRADNFTRRDFAILYNYLVVGGLDMYAAEWIPNITHDQRPRIEAEGQTGWGSVEGVEDYQGFTGYEPDPNNTGELIVAPRSEQPFYFPIHFGEPAENVANAGHFDLFSPPYERPYILKALETWEPVLTAKFEVMKREDLVGGYTVELYHPGTPLPDEFDVTTAHDLSNVVININSVLYRAATHQTDRLEVYLYDTTFAAVDDDVQPDFLGGIARDVETAELVMLNETEYEGLSETYLYFERTLAIAGRQWKVVAIPKHGNFKPNITSTILSGGLIFVGAVFLSMWIINNMQRANEMNRVITKAAAEAAIVASLFPANVRERMIQDALAKQKGVYNGEDFGDDEALVGSGYDGAIETRLLSSEGIFGSKPIADLHPYTTIMFLDLVGFTAWSSSRDPSQVFQLLETVYHSFDTIAKRRQVYKVETVGDCYVAIAGLPTPRKDHAVVMARFANNCRDQMQKICNALETVLGPDTGDLACRVGLHSGQVVGGVLRGEKSRFQLFGDTVNMASRMESTGARNRIQMSRETAELLQDAGKGNWVVPRDDPVAVKGKGTLSTFWLQMKVGSRASSNSLSELDIEESCRLPAPVVKKERVVPLADEKTERLVAWNVEVLCSLLRKIVARRAARSSASKRRSESPNPKTQKQPEMVLDEVKDIIKLPSFNETAVRRQVDPNTIVLSAQVTRELESLVSNIASMYRDNPFHSFEHASHVTMSVLKMMTRIVDPKEIAAKKRQGELNNNQLEAELHDHTFGITSDPLTQFACVFSALIHDLDHHGVSNMTLVQEASPLAIKYKNKSVAEQNSVDLAFDLLMRPEYTNLRVVVCSGEEESSRFRSLVVNSVMATDVMDKELGLARKARWAKAFDEDASNEEGDEVAVNRKATIVIEHLIQASDISHTMQHWHVYVKWNEKLFHELYRAYKNGRLQQDPSMGWYNGELGFFDYYIIPLAKKLFTCGVFGVSSDEFLNYALENREEWARKGASMVAQYVKSYEEQYGKVDPMPQPLKPEESSVTASSDDNSSVGLPIDSVPEPPQTEP
ncbi:Receptor-type guanylate cyclase gcy [Seminavis robusta]|uniref:Receptor-type guanylate cyclase gcy n=1 Tax=Seminavis robusta TaxID=568900 RepID=A0A9N8EM98_9STRA|nr:Receptor-type guanylate cyclase gcy [Seminavis robusta]|eukprot:Sro1202_g252010.1 Receptor-type guanylate cyclase gcy (1194) ;mRNA; f:10426-15240